MKPNFADENFVDSVEAYSGSQLNKITDIKKLIRIVGDFGKEKEFEEIMFTSKYVCGLMRVVKTAPSIPEVNNVDQIKEDLNVSINMAKDQIEELISEVDHNQKRYFEETYLSQTAQSFSNLYQLFSDLDSIKKYVNHLKRIPE